MTELDDSNVDFDSFQRRVIHEFRANRGQVGGMFDGSTLALLTTVGARSGRRRTSPLAYIDLQGTPAVVASAMGAPFHPAWFHNLRTNPVVTVETGTETFEAIATIPTGEERDRLFAMVVEQDPGFADYQQRTTRIIPVVTLQRVETGTAWTRGMGDFIVESHDWLRRELAHLRGHLEAPELSLRPDLAEFDEQLRNHCMQFCGALDEHHAGEDRGAFPVLAERFPGLASTLQKLVGEHARIAALNRSLRELLERFDAGASSTDTVRRELDRIASELEEHFDFEERNLTSALNALGPAPNIP